MSGCIGVFLPWEGKMNLPVFYTGAEVAQLLGWPSYTELRDETARVRQAGLVIVGANLKEATAAWSREVVEQIPRPK